MAKTYKEAGVNIDAGNEFIKKITPHVKSTYKPEVLAGVGGFAAHFSLNLEGIKEPILVSSTDGVGTKLKIAQKLNKYDTIGIDLVAMCVNDIACSGAKPLFFLDYFAMDKLKPDEHAEIIKGITNGCKISKCSLIGGETAELPGIYQKGDFDLAGFSVGIVDKNKIIDGSSISIGDTIIGIASTGVHSNGYSLVRAVIKEETWNDSFEDSSIGETLLTPTKIYTPLIQNLIRDFKISGIVHITGGGLVENIPRILPSACQAGIQANSWEKPLIFDLIKEKGGISEPEMQRVFNLGIGMVIIVPNEQAGDIRERIKSLGEKAWIIGKINKRPEFSPKIILE